MNGCDLGGRRFLVIDDQEPVRQVVSQMLSHLGADTIEAAGSAGEGLKRLQAAGQAFDAVFCDLQMPGQDGIEVLRAAARLGLRTEFVLMSGEDRSVLNAAGNLAREMGLRVLAVLPKPFDLGVISGVMRRLGSAEQTVARTDGAAIRLDDLQDACSFGEIVPFFQPKVDIATGAAGSVEALARWRHPEHGLIEPGVFIPLAEERGLIDFVTEIMFGKALDQCRLWKDDGLALRISLNLSVDSFDRLDLPERVSAMALAHGIEPEQLVMEVTESRFSDDPTALLDITTRFRLKQFKLSIDDFGTGFSGLRQLQRLPFTELKIDRAFVTGASRDSRARLILEASVKLAKELGLTIVAEGVETKDDWDLVAGLGCDFAQGYYISRPMPAEEVSGWVADWNAAHGAPAPAGKLKAS